MGGWGGVGGLHGRTGVRCRDEGTEAQRKPYRRLARRVEHSEAEEIREEVQGVCTRPQPAKGAVKGCTQWAVGRRKWDEKPACATKRRCIWTPDCSQPTTKVEMRVPTKAKVQIESMLRKNRACFML